MTVVTLVVGNPKAHSRTAQIARDLAARVFGPLEGGSMTFSCIELSDYADELFVWPSPVVTQLNERVAQSDIVIFASPTYKATYTGLLKAFLDRYAKGGLSRVAAIAVMTGGGEAHFLGVNTSLVPLLLELDAAVIGRGLYFNTENMDRVDAEVESMARDVRAALRRLGTAAAAATEAGL